MSRSHLLGVGEADWAIHTLQILDQPGSTNASGKTGEEETSNLSSKPLPISDSSGFPMQGEISLTRQFTNARPRVAPTLST